MGVRIPFLEAPIDHLHYVFWGTSQASALLQIPTGQPVQRFLAERRGNRFVQMYVPRPC